MRALPVNRNLLLRQLNQVRVAFEMPEITEIQKGVKSQPTHCPIAMSLRNGWTVYAEQCETRFTWTGDLSEMPDLTKIVKALKRIPWVTGAEIMWAENDEQQNSIWFDNSRTMTNFIERFDDGELDEFARDWYPNEIPKA